MKNKIIKTHQAVQSFFFSKTLFLFLILFSLAGCAVQLPAHFWQNKNQRVAVISVKAPSPNHTVFTYIGQGRQYSASAPISEPYLKYFDLAWYRRLPNDFVSVLQKKGITAKAYPEFISSKQLTKRNFPEIARQTNSDKLLIIDLTEIGILQQIQGILDFPSYVRCVMEGKLVDVNTGRVLWRTYIWEQKKFTKFFQQPSPSALAKSLPEVERDAKKRLLNSFLENSQKG